MRFPIVGSRITHDDVAISAASAEVIAGSVCSSEPVSKDAADVWMSFISDVILDKSSTLRARIP